MRSSLSCTGLRSPFRSAPSHMERNLYKVKILPYFPTRFWRKMTAPGESRRTARAIRSIRGEHSSKPTAEKIMEKMRLYRSKGRRLEKPGENNNQLSRKRSRGSLAVPPLYQSGPTLNFAAGGFERREKLHRQLAAATANVEDEAVISRGLNEWGNSFKPAGRAESTRASVKL